jgi:hypothetical protein
MKPSLELRSASGARFQPANVGMAGWKPALRFILFVSACAAAFAQQPQRPTPRLSYVYPAGGQRGTTFTVWVGGQNLNGAAAVYFSGQGIHAKVVGYERPLTQKEINDLRERAQQLQEKRTAGKEPLTPAELAEAADIRQKLANRPNRQANPAMQETAILEVAIAADAPLRTEELRVRANAGLSNPLAFCVGALPEFSEPPVIATTNPAPRKRDADPRTGRPKPTTLPIVLPANVNGQILPGEVDRFSFAAKRGQRLTVAVSARALIPYLADAVPGWFQATLALFDAQGREIGYVDDYRFNPDPALAFEIPADGEYAIEIKDSIYRGREDFVYRIAIGELPFVASVFPLGGATSGEATFDLSGWNLGGNRLAFDTHDKTAGTFSVTVGQGPQPSNAVALALDPEPETLETEPNNAAGAAQVLALPVIVNGRIDRKGDEDFFVFEGRAGEEVIAEVFARRLQSPVDSVLELLDATGARLAFNDDCEDKGAALLTHQADSRLAVKLPADGRYFLRLADAQRQGGAEFAYRLRVGAPRPDYELRVVPSTLNARGGTHVPVTIYALRRDGFDGDIVLGLRNAPRGFALSGARIPAGQDKIALTLFVPPMPRDEPYAIGFGGAAQIGSRLVAHAAVPAEDMMQAFAYHHLVPTKELLLQITGRGGAGRVLAGAPVKFIPGKNARLTLGVAVPRDVRNVHAELRDAPPGITIERASLRNDTVELTLACDPAKAKPGLAQPARHVSRGALRGVGRCGAAVVRPVAAGISAAKNE